MNKEWINCSCHFAIAIFISAQIFEFIALPILHVPIRYLPMMTMRNVIIETINSFLKPFIRFSTLLIKQDDNHEQQNQCHHHPFFFFKSFHKISPLKIKRGFGKGCCWKQGKKQQLFWLLILARQVDVYCALSYLLGCSKYLKTSQNL